MSHLNRKKCGNLYIRLDYMQLHRCVAGIYKYPVDVMHWLKKSENGDIIFKMFTNWIGCSFWNYRYWTKYDTIFILGQDCYSLDRFYNIKSRDSLKWAVSKRTSYKLQYNMMYFVVFAAIIITVIPRGMLICTAYFYNIIVVCILCLVNIFIFHVSLYFSSNLINAHIWCCSW